MSDRFDNTLQRTANDLNQLCKCRTLDPEQLRHQLESEKTLTGLFQEISLTRPHLFSSTSVFISEQQLQAMKSIISAVNSVVQSNQYIEKVLEKAPAIAQIQQHSRGVFMGFDFHLSEQGPQLIEINTNAGGALLNSALARAQQVCCQEMQLGVDENSQSLELEQQFFLMFESEWQKQKSDQPLKYIAIVDDDPLQQYLYPEFQLFERLFARFGITAFIVDAKNLEWKNGVLSYQGQHIDMVYNRLTDFYLQEVSHNALRMAYEAGAVVVTPHPQAHALYADKRNLILISNKQSLIELDVEEDIQKILLAGIPRTQLVSLENAEELWAQRRQLFFKPAFGYGSKAAYRGDKLTRRVWNEILGGEYEGEYVAQVIALPSERAIQVNDINADLKLDIRAYVYIDETQLLAARLYAGQTTNFRTEGGGFAPVFVV